MNRAVRSSVDHHAFFVALANLTRSDDEWAEMVAGLVVLRLVDGWVHDGARGLDPEAPQVLAVAEAIEAIRAGSVHRAVLAALLDSLLVTGTVSTQAGLRLLATRLATYGRALHFDARWELAADVYRTTIHHVPVKLAALEVADAWVQLGGCLRTLGRADEAMDSYRGAAEIAREQGLRALEVRARIGEANVALQRGNLPVAEAGLDRAITDARAAGDNDVLAIALHDRAHVAHRRGESARAAMLAYDALRLCADQPRRDRLLSDIATCLAEVGLRDAARDAHLVVAATAQEQYLRWVATINLLELAVLDRQESAFDDYRAQLEGQPLPPELSAYHHLYAARGFRTFGRSELASREREVAMEVAYTHGMNQVAAMAESDRMTDEHSVTPTLYGPPTITAVVDGLRDLRASLVGVER